MDKLAVYYMKDEYIDYLSKYDNRVPFNKGQTRPYVGVVVKHNGIDYFAPLSSPKPKHQLLKNGIDIFKIKDGKLGIINLNNMIPVKSENVIKINLDLKPQAYRNLINNQIQFINNNKNSLFKKVERLLKLYENKSIPQLNKRCCNFELLEKKCVTYNKGLLETKFIENTAKEEVAATTSIGAANNTKDKILSSYKNEFPAIKNISDKTAKIINKLNIDNGRQLSIQEIKQIHNKLGKRLETNYNEENLQEFKNLAEVIDDLKRSKLNLRQEQAHEKVKTNVESINKNIPEL